MTASYCFGDSDAAAERLALLAEVFAESSRSLIARSIPPHRDAVLDLGCGPGYSTRLIAETCRPARLIGLDASERYVSLARRLTADAGIDFAVHDATSLPLPAAPVDVVFSRLLLAHLPNPLEVVDGWRTQLRSGGVLVIEELDDIDTPAGPLRDYKKLAVQVVATGGASLFAGPLLAPLGGRSVEVLVGADVAARMFNMNLATWRRAAVDHDLAEDDRLDRLAEELQALTVRPGTEPVRWVLRHLVIPA